MTEQEIREQLEEAERLQAEATEMLERATIVRLRLQGELERLTGGGRRELGPGSARGLGLGHAEVI